METTSLRIAIQKSGRLTEKTTNLLENIGLKFDGFKDRLLVRSLNFDVELLLIRDDDIPEYVQDGICDLGIVGANVSLEKNADVEVIRDLQYGMCRLSVAVPKSSGFHNLQDLNNKRIATSYPNLTRKYFSSRGIDIKIVEISGAVEIAPRLDVADAIVDLVSSGGTLKTNGLQEMEIILHSQSQLIQTRKQIPAEKEELINKFLIRINGRQLAERSRYIMMNAPRESLDVISSLIPSLKSPTILPLADPDMIAIHSVIPTDKFWEVMEELKAAGASGIVMLPVESMIV
ncbi:MAG: ATP phosphoribosyltransferase [Rhodothermaceae bacterium]|nr:ATP phosphoribosyltransferase [Rhodothermaceae bacterium]